MASPDLPADPAAKVGVIETSDATFAQDVIERSRELPVVVDFWAEWCGPCRQLAPVLEKAIADYAGRILLVKAELDRVPQVATALQVSSIPAVMALRDGHIVDQFVGLISPVELSTWLGRLLPSPAQEKVSAAAALEQQDPRGAAAAYREALEQEPELLAARIGLGRTLLAQGDLIAAEEIVSALSARGFMEPEAEQFAAALAMRLMGSQAPDVATCRANLETATDKPNAELALAKALAANGDYQESLDRFLHLLATERAKYGETARSAMVDIFRVLGNDSELVTTYRRRLSSALY